MYLLSIETVFNQTSIALFEQQTLRAINTEHGNRNQSAVILPMIDGILSAHNLRVADLGLLVVNVGAGAFSGIRVGLAVAQAFGTAFDIKGVGVGSLLAYADKYRRDDAAKETPSGACLVDGTRIAVALDARQNELYFGEFIMQNGRLCTVNATLAPYGVAVDSDVLLGDVLPQGDLGTPLINAAAHTQQIVITPPNAADLAQSAFALMADGAAPAAVHTIAPMYLREKAWRTVAEQAEYRAQKAHRAHNLH